MLAVWETFVEMLVHSAMGGAYPLPMIDVQEIDAATERQALATATEGAERARGGGMTGEARTEQRKGSVADTILSVAAELDAQAILLGTRGRGGLKSLLLGSVSHAVVHQADRPVVVVPSAELASARAGLRS